MDTNLLPFDVEFDYEMEHGNRWRIFFNDDAGVSYIYRIVDEVELDEACQGIQQLVEAAASTTPDRAVVGEQWRHSSGCNSGMTVYDGGDGYIEITVIFSVLNTGSQIVTIYSMRPWKQ